MKRFATILLPLVVVLFVPTWLLADTQVVDGIEWSYSLSDGQATVTGANPAVGDLVIPETLGGCPVTSLLRAFEGCSDLISITIPNCVKNIGSFSFNRCSGLTSITIPNSVTTIGNYAFWKCTGLTSIAIPNSVTSIAKEAFSGCSGLTSVTIPANMENIGDEPFRFCNNVTETRVLLSDMTMWVTNSINSKLMGARRLFSGDVEMFEAVIPDGVTAIGNDSFLNCSDLTSVTIPNSVTSIGNNAFSGCTNAVILLKTDSLPSDVLAVAALDQVRGVYCYRSERAAVIAAIGFEKLFGCLDENENPTIFQAEILSASIRDNDPNVMDVDYVVHSDSPTVNVRALAFENGERGFGTVLRPKTFIDGTGANIGDGIAANVGHRLSWRIPSEWNTDYGTVSFEVLAMEPDKQLLPMHFVTIPAAEGHPKTIVSVNDLSKSAFVASSGYYQAWGMPNYHFVIGHHLLFNSLLWLYASGEPDLSVSNESLFCGTSELVRHAVFTKVSDIFGTIPGHTDPNGDSIWSLNPNAFRYVFGKMGYRLLDDEDELAWINENTWLDLQPQQFRQYAVKTVEE